MQRFGSTVTDHKGRPVHGAEVYVMLKGGSGQAQVYGSGSVADTIPQPIRTNRSGQFEFWVWDGVEIEVTITKDGTVIGSFGGYAYAPRHGSVDVTDPQFGADPSGVDDSTVAIQAAFDYAGDNDTEVFFPPGRYEISDELTYRAPVRCAEGPSSSVILSSVKFDATMSDKAMIRSELAETFVSGMKFLFGADTRYGLYCDGSAVVLQQLAAEYGEDDVTLAHCGAPIFLTDCTGAVDGVVASSAHGDGVWPLDPSAFGAVVGVYESSAMSIRNVRTTGGAISLDIRDSSNVSVRDCSGADFCYRGINIARCTNVTILSPHYESTMQMGGSIHVSTDTSWRLDSYAPSGPLYTTGLSVIGGFLNDDNDDPILPGAMRGAVIIDWAHDISVSPSTIARSTRGGGVQIGPRAWAIKGLGDSPMQETGRGGANSEFGAPARNVWPNPKFEHWLKGFDIELENVTLSQTTDVTLSAPNAMLLNDDSCPSGDNAYSEHSISDIEAGKYFKNGDMVYLSAWVYISDGYSDNDSTRPAIGISIGGGAYLWSLPATVPGSWHFLTVAAEWTSASEMDFAFALKSSETGTLGVNKYIVVDNIVLCKAGEVFSGAGEYSVNLSTLAAGHWYPDSPWGIADGPFYVEFAGATPTCVNKSYIEGDRVLKPTVSPGGYWGWICTTAGAGGTAVWNNYGSIAV